MSKKTAKNTESETIVVQPRSFLDIFAQDADKEQNGTWVKLAKYPQIRVKIRSIKSDMWAKKLQEAQVPFKHKIQVGEISLAESKTIISRAMAFGLVLDWEGVFDADGKAIPFSPKKALEFFEMPRAADFADQIYRAAEIEENFRLDEAKATEKN